MALVELRNECLTCNQQVGADPLSILIEKDGQISDVLRKHFWFTEVDFLEKEICQTCWDQVIHFHQFYVTVEELYRNRLASQIVKSEPSLDEHEDPLKVSSYKLDAASELSEILVKVETGEDNGEFSDQDGESRKIKLDSFTQQKSDRKLRAQKEKPENLVKEELEEWFMVEMNASENDQSCDDDDGDWEDNSEENHSETPKTIKRTRRPYKSNRAHIVQPQEDIIREHVKYNCDQCGHESKSFRLFILHSRHEHGNKTPFLLCCGRKFIRRAHLYEHVRLCNNPEEFRCELCQKKLSTQQGLNNHYECHAFADERNFKCERCPRSFATRSVYVDHIRKHEQRDRDEKLRCKDCNKSFSGSYALKTHIAEVHMGIATHKCQFCEASYLTPAGLSKHRNSTHRREWQEKQNNKELQEDFIGVSRPKSRKISKVDSFHNIFK